MKTLEQALKLIHETTNGVVVSIYRINENTFQVRFYGSKFYKVQIIGNTIDIIS